MKPYLSISCCVAAAALCATVAAPARAGELGFAITSIQYGPYDNPADCPDGFALTPKQTFLQALPAAERKEFVDRDKRVGSLAAWVSRVASNRRGPNGEDSCEAPQLIHDPPMRIGQSKTSFGLDLDGGDKTTHCDHDEFTGIKGEAGIDNQIARLTACIIGLRKENNRRNTDLDAGTRSADRIVLIRVTKVDNMENDDDVTVDFYKSADTFIKDGSGAPLPDATFRADKTAPVFHAVTRGKIVNGVLMTAPVDAHFLSGDGYDWVIRGARFQISLRGDGYSEGMLAGYFDLESFWHSWAREYQQGENIGYSCPALYEAMHKLADGYKDAATGQCTALSSAFAIKAVRGFVLPPAEPPARVSENTIPAPSRMAALASAAK